MMDYFEMCDAAECSPDFAVVHRLTLDQEVRWLRNRLLLRANLFISELRIRAAIAEYQARPRGAVHTVRLPADEVDEFMDQLDALDDERDQAAADAGCQDSPVDYE